MNVKEVAKILNVSEKTVYRWAQSKEIPSYRIGEQYRFNGLEILEWATAKRISIKQDILLSQEAGEISLSTLTESLKTGGINYRVGGDDKPSVLKAIIDCLRLPEGADREFLFRIFLARENLASTGIGDGIAIPHARTPVIFHMETPQVALCFLEKPVEFNAMDGQTVYALFTLICPNIKTHLKLLSSLSFALRKPSFNNALKEQASREELLAMAEEAEAEFYNGESI